MTNRSKWTIQDYFVEVIYLSEICEIPEIGVSLAELKAEIVARFSADERKNVGFLF